MNNSSFASVHFPEDKGNAARANTFGRQISHLTQLCFASGAEPFDVTNQPLTFGELPSKRLINQVLNSLQQFAALNLQHLGVWSTEVNQAFGRRFRDRNFHLQTGA